MWGGIPGVADVGVGGAHGRVAPVRQHQIREVKNNKLVTKMQASWMSWCLRHNRTLKNK